MSDISSEREADSANLLPKRIVTKIGDVFETEAGLKIQLVAIDPHQLMSDVLAAYGHEGHVVANGTSSGRMIYCAHTTASAGVREGLWRKIGKAPLPDLSNVAFKAHVDAELVSDSNYNILRSKLRLKPEGFWYYWKLGGRKVRRVSEKKVCRIEAEEGSVYPAREFLEELSRRTGRKIY